MTLKNSYDCFFSSLPSSVCFCPLPPSLNEGRKGGGKQRQHCSADRWMQWPGLSQQHVPNRLDCTAHCIATPYPHQARRGRAWATAWRWKVNENNKHWFTHKSDSFAMCSPSFPTCSTACDCSMSLIMYSLMLYLTWNSKYSQLQMLNVKKIGL